MPRTHCRKPTHSSKFINSSSSLSVQTLFTKYSKDNWLKPETCIAFWTLPKFWNLFTHHIQSSISDLFHFYSETLQEAPFKSRNVTTIQPGCLNDVRTRSDSEVHRLLTRVARQDASAVFSATTQQARHLVLLHITNHKQLHAYHI